MRKELIGAALLAASTAVAAENGTISLPSNHSVDVTIDRLESVLKEKGMTVFSRIDHAAGAAKVDKTIRPTQLLIFGNPKVGTPLMQCAQTVALDLPQKALAWEDQSGKVWLTYNDPAYLKTRHNIAGCDGVLEKVSGALNKFAQAATK
mgnify:FL=1